MFIPQEKFTLSFGKLRWYLDFVAEKYTSEHPLLTTTAWRNREYLTACMYFLPSEKSALEPQRRHFLPGSFTQSLVKADGYFHASLRVSLQ